MLPKEYRLPSAETRGLLQRGKRFSVPELQLVIQKSNRSVSRFGFVVSTKIDKRATRRNLMKRLLRESAQHAMMTIPSGWDILVIVKRRIDELSQNQVEAILTSVLARAAIIPS